MKTSSSLSPKQKNTIGPDSFSLISTIGRGSYAKVLLVKKRDNDKLYAMKIIKKRNVEKKSQQSHIENEKNVLILMAGSPFFVKVHFIFQTETKLYFVIDYCPGGELFSLLQKRKRFSEEQARFYAGQLVLAIEKLHQKSILYRDLKPENVLIDVDGYIKITDFGLSRMNHTDDDARSICGTPEYLAPEVLAKTGYGKPFDWWTLGAFLFELLTGFPPFYVSNRDELFHHIRFTSPNYPVYLSTPARSLLQGLLEKQPERRLGTISGAAEIKNHPWFSSINWTDLVQKKIASPFKPNCDQNFGVSNFDDEFTNMPPDSIETNNEGTLPRHYEGFSWEGNSDSHTNVTIRKAK